MAKQDKVIEQLQDKIREKKAQISKAEKPCWNTNCSFRYDENNFSNVVNLHTVGEPKILVSILAYLMSKSEKFAMAARILGVTEEFQWQGHSLADWQQDIETRLIKMQLSTRKKELEAAEAKLEQLLSPERKAAKELDSIKELLKES